MNDKIEQATAPAPSASDEIKALVSSAVKVALEEQAAQHASQFAFMLNRGVTQYPHLAEIKQEEKGIATARLIRALAVGRNNPDMALSHVRKANLGDRPAERVERALAAGDYDSGGFMLPEDFVQEMIDLLRPRSVIRAAGTPTIPMPLGTLTMPKQTGDATANYVGENKSIPVSEPTGGQIVMSAKKLATLVPVSNDLLLYQVGTSADRFIRDSMVRRMATREDQAFLRDDGTANTPKGIRYWAEAAHVSAISGTAVANIEADLKNMLNELETANVDMSGARWFMNPRTKNHLMIQRDAAGGNLLYPELRTTNPTIHGFPVSVSTNIPANLGGGSDSEMYFVNIPDMLIGEAGTMQIAVTDQASYTDGADTISTFQNDQSLVRAITRHDFAAQYEQSISIRTGVSY